MFSSRTPPLGVNGLVSYILETQLSFTTTVVTEQIGSVGNVSNLYSGGPSRQMRVPVRHIPL
jgi:hypothetical protein